MRHFVGAGYARSGIYNILALLHNNQSIEKKTDSGRPTTLSDKKLQRMLKRKAEGKVGFGAAGNDAAAAAKAGNASLRYPVYL